MKRVLGLLTAVLATGALVVATVSPAGAYPSSTPLLTTPTSTVNAGAPVTLQATGFAAGATVTFAIAGTTVGTAVANASGAATLVASSPPTAGTFIVTASSPDGRVASFSLTVIPTGATLPGTGSDSNSTALTAGVLVMIGAGLLGASILRRRTRAIAAA